jgi:hypothetical protein
MGEDDPSREILKRLTLRFGDVSIFINKTLKRHGLAHVATV